MATQRTGREEHVLTLEPAPPPAPRDLAARLAEDLEENGADVVRALSSEQSGESSRVRRGLHEEKEMLEALAADLRGEGAAYGPVLLGSAVVRAALDDAWSRAREGSREDKDVMAAIGKAFVGMKERRSVPVNLKRFVDFMEADLRRLNQLIPTEKAKALRYKGADLRRQAYSGAEP
jgi:hypothetical protein